MREILDDIDRWLAAGRRLVLARVVSVEGSAPRPPGAAMAVNEAGEVTGSVSGGCVETAVVADALAALQTGKPHLASFGYSDAEAFAVGLTCGGAIELFIEPLGGPGLEPRILAALREELSTERQVALATLIDTAGGSEDQAGERAAAPGATLLVRPGSLPLGSLGPRSLDAAVQGDALGAIDAGRTDVRRYGPAGEATGQDLAVFIQVFTPPPRMLIFGAVDFTAALAKVAKVLGYRVTVCDARPAFATSARFPMADEVVVAWPDRHLAAVGPTLGGRDAVCVLTHDPKFDVPAIVAALGTQVGYIGAMGSRRTAADRLQRLRQSGVGDEAMSRVMAPIGLDIGARTPEETAVSICAEIIALRSAGHTGSPLQATSGPIHGPGLSGHGGAASGSGGNANRRAR